MRLVLACAFVLACSKAVAVDFYEVNPNLVNEVGRAGSVVIIYKAGALDEAEKACYKAGFVVLQRSSNSRSLLCKAPVPSVLQLKLAEILSSPIVERVEPNAIAAAAPPKQIARPAPQPPTLAQTKREVVGIFKEEFQDFVGARHKFVGYTLEVRRDAGTLVDTFRIILSNDITNLNFKELIGQEVTVVAEKGSRNVNGYLFVTQIKQVKRPVRRQSAQSVTNIQVRAR